MDGIVPSNQNKPNDEQPKTPDAVTDEFDPHSEQQANASDDVSYRSTANSTEAEEEADEAVVAGVAAIGGAALKWHRFKQFFVHWWNNKKARYWTFVGVGVFLIAIFALPFTRYGVLNAVGIRGDAKIFINDQETQLPLKNATIRIAELEYKTGDDGQAYIENSRLGNQEVRVSKPGYGDYIGLVQIGVTTSDLGQIQLIPTGTRLVYKITDFHNGTAIAGAIAEVGDASAFSDDTGLIRLVVPPTDEAVTVTIKKEGYNDLDITSDSQNSAEQQAQLVINGWHVFVSKRSGKLDLYRSMLDGSNAEVVLAATGKERESGLGLMPSQNGTHAAFVSTRDGERNDDGFALSGLYIVDLESKETIRADLSEAIQIVGWVDNRLVYVSHAAGESGYSANRMQIRSFLIGNLTSDKLVGSNYFDNTMLAKGRVYYGPTQSLKQNQPKEEFYSMLPDGTDEKSYIKESVGRIVRTDFDVLVVETYNRKQNYKTSWHEFILSSQVTKKLEGRPTNFEYWSRAANFVESQDGKKTAWLDERDGRQVIVVRDEEGTKQEVWRGLGATSPIRWVGNSLILFRQDKDGVFDYVVSTIGGDAVKLSESTNVTGSGNLY